MIFSTSSALLIFERTSHENISFSTKIACPARSSFTSLRSFSAYSRAGSEISPHNKWTFSGSRGRIPRRRNSAAVQRRESAAAPAPEGTSARHKPPPDKKRRRVSAAFPTSLRGSSRASCALATEPSNACAKCKSVCACVIPPTGAGLGRGSDAIAVSPLSFSTFKYAVQRSGASSSRAPSHSELGISKKLPSPSHYSSRYRTFRFQSRTDSATSNELRLLRQNRQRSLL